MNFKIFYESKDRKYNIEIIDGPYTNEDIPNKAYSEDVFYDIIVDGVKMTWNATRMWYWAVDSSKHGTEGWKSYLGLHDDIYEIQVDKLSDQINNAIKSYNITKHLSPQTKETFGGLTYEL
jgi:hypothetical protein